MQQLNFCRKEILGKLSAYGVKDIRLRVGKVFRQKKEEPDPVEQMPQKVSDDDALFIDGLVASVSDEELKTSIRNAAENYLSEKNKKIRGQLSL
jgi:hypothetical protein